MAYNVREIVMAVVQANASVATLVFLGIVATYCGIWDKQGISDLGKLVFHMSMPALVFSKVLVQISIEHLQTLWVLPVFCILHVMSGYVVMSIINKVVRMNAVESKATSACMMFGNCGSLAIAVVQSLCKSEPLRSKMGGQEDCTSIAVADCAFYVIAWNILVWGVGDVLLFPEADEDKADTPPRADSLESAGTGSYKLPLLGSMPTLATVESPVGSMRRVKSMHNGEAQNPLAYIKIKSRQEISAPDNGGMKKTSSCVVIFDNGVHTEHKFEVKLSKTALSEVVSRMPIVGGLYAQRYCADCNSPKSSPGRSMTHLRNKAQTCCDSIWKSVKQFSRSPPIRAAGLAVLLGMFPPVKALFVGEEAPLAFMMSGINQMGTAQVPVSMVMLSGSGTLRYLEKLKAAAREELNSEYGQEVQVQQFQFGRLATAFILFGRLLVMPFVGYFWWRLFVQTGLWPSHASVGFEYGGGMLAFICLIESCVPTAQTIVTMFIVHGDLLQGGAIAELVLVQYALAVVFYSASVAYFEMISL